MAKSNSSSNLFTTLLTVAFIVLKLTNVIDWSWLWVLSPIWISVLIALALLPIVFKLKMKEQENKQFNKFFQERLKKMSQK